MQKSDFNIRYRYRPFLFHIKIWAYQYWACPLLILAGQMSFHQNMQILSMYRENAEVANTEIHLYTDGTKLNVLKYDGIYREFLRKKICAII